jgi:hypothetical protein
MLEEYARRSGHRGYPQRLGGTQTVTEPGRTLMFSFLLAGRAPPSSSKRTFWSNRILNLFPCVTWAKGDRSG